MKIQNAIVRIQNATIRHFPPGALRVTFVGASQASHPVDEATNGFIPPGFDYQTLTIPKPPGVVDGDLLLVVCVASLQDSAITPPSGWTEIETLGGGVGQRRATTFKKLASGEPSEYDFTKTADSNFTGCMIAFRNASLTLEDSNKQRYAGSAKNGFDPLDVTSSVIGSAYCLLVGGVFGQVTDFATIELTATPDLLEGAEHSVTGYIKNFPHVSGCFYKEDVDIATVSGEHVNWDVADAGGQMTFPYIINPS